MLLVLDNPTILFHQLLKRHLLAVILWAQQWTCFLNSKTQEFFFCQLTSNVLVEELSSSFHWGQLFQWNWEIILLQFYKAVAWTGSITHYSNLGQAGWYDVLFVSKLFFRRNLHFSWFRPVNMNFCEKSLFRLVKKSLFRLVKKSLFSICEIPLFE